MYPNGGQETASGAKASGTLQCLQKFAAKARAVEIEAGGCGEAINDGKAEDATFQFDGGRPKEPFRTNRGRTEDSTGPAKEPPAFATQSSPSGWPENDEHPHQPEPE